MGPLDDYRESFKAIIFVGSFVSELQDNWVIQCIKSYAVIKYWDATVHGLF